jgi:hypothetical protein
MEEVMNKIVLFIFALILVACSPQVTVTSQATVTLAPSTQTPIPTPTLHPQFIEAQNLISDLSEALTLLPNGQIEENGVVIPNLQVNQNGEITILVEGESLVVDSADITFEDGLSINGYELNENGEWVEAGEAVKLDNGVVLTLEDKNGDGISEVTEVHVDNDELSEEQKELLVNQLKPEYVGFTPDEAKLYYGAESQTYWVGSVDDPSNVIARQDAETGRLVWDYDKMLDENGEISFMSTAKTVEMRGGNPVDMKVAEIISDTLMRELTSKFLLDSGLVGSGEHFSLLPVYVYNETKSNAIVGFVFTNDKKEVLDSGFANFRGTFLFLDKDGDVKGIDLEHFDCEMRFLK